MSGWYWGFFLIWNKSISVFTSASYRQIFSICLLLWSLQAYRLCWHWWHLKKKCLESESESFYCHCTVHSIRVFTQHKWSKMLCRLEVKSEQMSLGCFCRRRVTLPPWHWLGVCSTTEAPEQRRAVTSLCDLCFLSLMGVLGWSVWSAKTDCIPSVIYCV